MQLQKSSEPINYEEVLNEVIEGCKGDEIIPFVRCPKFPFSYCEKWLSKRGTPWRTKVAIAKREDCPDSVVVKLIKRNGERFLGSYLYNCDKHPLSDKIIEAIINKPFGIDTICLRTVLMSEKMKEKIVYSQFNNEETKSRGYFFKTRLLDFVRHQDSLPQQCINEILSAIEIQISGGDLMLDDFSIRALKRSRTMLQCMKTPVDEGFCIDCINKYDKERDKSLLEKIASNPSISKYVEMVLMVKFANEESVLAALKRAQSARLAWRNENPSTSEVCE